MEEKKDMLGHDIPQEPDDTYAEQKHHPLLRGKSITGGDRTTITSYRCFVYGPKERLFALVISYITL